MQVNHIFQKQVQILKSKTNQEQNQKRKLNLQNNSNQKKKSIDILQNFSIPIPEIRYRKLFRNKNNFFSSKDNIEQRKHVYIKTVKYLNSNYTLPLKKQVNEKKEEIIFKNFIINANDFESDSEIIFKQENEEGRNDDDEDFRGQKILGFLREKKIIKKKKKIIFDVLKFIKIQCYKVKKKYKCKYCDVYFVGQSALGGHITKNHGEESKKFKNKYKSKFIK